MEDKSLSQTLAKDPLPRRGAGAKIGGCIVATLLGALYPFLLSAQIALPMPMILLPVLLTVWLYVWAGTGAAIALNASLTLMSLLTFGLPGALMSLAATLLPTLPMLDAMRKQQPFFDQLERGTLLFVLGLALAVGIAFLAFGGDLIGKLFDLLASMADALPEEVLAMSLSMAGLDASSLGELSLREGMAQLFQAAKVLYSAILPGNLVSGTVLTALLGVTLGNRAMARRGACTPQSYVTMDAWRLPARISLAAAGAILVTYFMASSGYPNGEAIFRVFWDLGMVAFCVQAIGSLARRFMRRSMRRGSGLGASVALVLALCLLGLGIAPMLYGAGSALFGTEGAIRKFLKRLMDDNKKD